MLRRSRVIAARTAVAFFNMKHFQAKAKYTLTPQNTFETLSTVLSPGDKLLRQSVSGGGGARVLVLDAQQKVKGVYLPVFCMPHPSTIASGGNSLGIAVAEYTRLIESTSATQNTGSNGTASTLPTVLVVVSHPQGLAYGTFRADGKPGVPIKNIALSPMISHVKTQEKATNIASTTLTSSGLGAVMPLLQVGSGFAETVLKVYKELNGCEHAAQLTACSTFVWVQRSSGSSTSFEAARSVQQYWEREKSSGDGDVALVPGGISFLDRRWIILTDTVLRPDPGVNLYTRDSSTGDRIVDAIGLQSALCKGSLLLDHAPRTAAHTAGANKHGSGSK
ncbi:hypothetical protein JKF63_00111 [Porcisia hertigi]|uniref:Uncharacterized protein n=1 Tax=Porcisia hertigi TaxID=2761500 RepID=A0A836HPF0_9TRYP|nr:hypothetical protein JKF63_00111 [Porcisia hertigi]